MDNVLERFSKVIAELVLTVYSSSSVAVGDYPWRVLQGSLNGATVLSSGIHGDNFSLGVTVRALVLSHRERSLGMIVLHVLWLCGTVSKVHVGATEMTTTIV